MSVNHDTFKALQELGRMTVGQLRERYLDLFGEETKSHNKAYLQKRIAWRIQFLVEGGLTERAKARAAELARNSELRVRQKRDPYKWGNAELRSRSVKGSLGAKHDPRTPPPGVILHREFKGQDVIVTVVDDGFEYEERTYKSLSAIATEVAGTRWNGYTFFGLGSTASKRKEATA